MPEMHLIHKKNRSASRGIPRTRRAGHGCVLSCCLILLFVCSALPAYAAGKSSDSESWVAFQSGKRLFEERSFGQALGQFQTAINTRREAFSTASTWIEAVFQNKAVAADGDNLDHVLYTLARRDLLDHQIKEVREKAKGSIKTQAELFRTYSLSGDFERFLDGLLLVLDHKTEASIGGKCSALRKACTDLERFPEAEYWVGRIYLSEGELKLAELQFSRSYDMRDALEIADDYYVILGSLVDVYHAQGNWRSYEQTLEQIMSADPLFGSRNEFMRDSMERTLAAEGFDRFMILYRGGSGPWTAQEAALGEQYLQDGRPQAVICLAASINEILARCIDQIKIRDPSYVYTTLDEILIRIDGSRDLAAYAENMKLYRGLYYLGEALAAGGYRGSARAVFASLYTAPGSGPWAARAQAAANRAPGSKAPVY